MLRLAGIDPGQRPLAFDDTAINLPERRADHVILLGKEGDAERGAFYLEYQLRPAPERTPEWEFKRSAIRLRLGAPVILVVIYLEKGDRATFPAGYTDELRGRSNEFHFTAIRLWEHAARIRSGELWQLAPLLVLCEDKPSAETFRTELQLISNSGAPEEVQADLFAVALRVGARSIPRAMLEAIFREALPMVQGASIIDDWIAEGEARGKAAGELHGRLEEARRLLRTLLEARFGEIPGSLGARIDAADREWCETFLRQAARAESLDELRW